MDANNNRDKVDLSSVNKADKKSTRSSLGISKTFKRQKGPRRDEEGKFTAGSGGLKKVKSLNWKRAFPLVVMIAVVGGFLVYQSFAATNKPRVQSKDCASVPLGFQGSSITGKNVQTYFLQFHKVAPTTDELIYWSQTRVKELQAQHGRTNCTIHYKIYQEIQRTKPQGLSGRTQNKSAQSNDVLTTIYAEQLGLKEGLRSTNQYVTRRAATRSPLAVVPVMGNVTNYAAQWGSNWPDKVKVCAIVYPLQLGVNLSDITLTLNVSANKRSVKSVKASDTPNLNANEKVEYGDRYGHGAAYTPRGAYHKAEICTSPVEKRAPRTSRGRTVPATFSISTAVKTSKKDYSTRNTIPQQVPALLEQYVIKKAN